MSRQTTGTLRTARAAPTRKERVANNRLELDELVAAMRARWVGNEIRGRDGSKGRYTRRQRANAVLAGDADTRDSEPDSEDEGALYNEVGFNNLGGAHEAGEEDGTGDAFEAHPRVASLPTPAPPRPRTLSEARRGAARARLSRPSNLSSPHGSEPSDSRSRSSAPASPSAACARPLAVLRGRAVVAFSGCL